MTQKSPAKIAGPFRSLGLFDLEAAHSFASAIVDIGVAELVIGAVFAIAAAHVTFPTARPSVLARSAAVTWFDIDVVVIHIVGIMAMGVFFMTLALFLHFAGNKGCAQNAKENACRNAGFAITGLCRGAECCRDK